MDNIKPEEIWEEDLDPDAEPSLEMDLQIVGPICGFCDQMVQDADELMQHASSEHDINTNIFEGVDLDDPTAVQEAFFRAANLQREFVSLGEVERCQHCGFLSTSMNVLAAHKCTSAQTSSAQPSSAQPDSDPFSSIRARDPLSVPKTAQADVENIEKVKQAQSFTRRSNIINQVINSTAKSCLVNRVIKPLAKPKVALTVGNVIEMALVETVSQAGLKVGSPEVYHENTAVEMVYKLCMIPQRLMAEQLRTIPAETCLQLLQLLRTRRIRVPANTTDSLTNLMKFSVGSNNRLRTILPAPSADGSHLTLMESLLEEARVKVKEAAPVIQVQGRLLAPSNPVVRKKPTPGNVSEDEMPIFLTHLKPIITLDATPVQSSSPPPRKSSKEANLVCEDCSRTFECEYTFTKHLQWQSFSQKDPEAIFCRFCPPNKRKFTYCEKGLKKHVGAMHFLADNYQGPLSVDGNIHENYKCGHCKRTRTFQYLLLMRHHIAICCKKQNCSICPEYVKKPGKPSKKKPPIKKQPMKKKKEKKVLKVVVPKSRLKSKKLAPVECVIIKEEANGNLNEEDVDVRPQFAFVAIKSEPDNFMCEDEMPVVTKSEMETKSAAVFECVACDFQASRAERLRSHFLEQHPSSIDEFQMSVSRCGSVCARWVCPLCGNIFATEEAFLGHVNQHGVESQELLAQGGDLRYLPTLRTTLFALKAKK